MKSIPLTQGKIALISDEDYERVSKHSWCFSAGRYAQSRIKGKAIYLHRFILDAKPGEEVDHKNRDTLDNRRENLRMCNHYQNMNNVVKTKKNSTGYRGVYLDKRRGVYYAQISFRGKVISSWKCATAIEAARAYNALSINYNGEFAVLNDV
jgi:hypothetical protein